MSEQPGEGGGGRARGGIFRHACPRSEQAGSKIGALALRVVGEDVDQLGPVGGERALEGVEAEAGSSKSVAIHERDEEKRQAARSGPGLLAV